MAKTISLNRAIGEKALLTDRIAKLTANLTAVMIGKENGSKVKGIEQTELAKTIKADQSLLLFQCLSCKLVNKNDLGNGFFTGLNDTRFVLIHTKGGIHHLPIDFNRTTCHSIFGLCRIFG